jgi:hypothetical protein
VVVAAEEGLRQLNLGMSHLNQAQACADTRFHEVHQAHSAKVKSWEKQIRRLSRVYHALKKHVAVSQLSHLLVARTWPFFMMPCGHTFLQGLQPSDPFQVLHVP